MRFKLTANQINIFDEVVSDRKSAKTTLEIALNFHANRTAEIDKVLKGLWCDMGSTHGIDPESNIFYIRSIDGSVVVTDENPESDAP